MPESLASHPIHALFDMPAALAAPPTITARELAAHGAQVVVFNALIALALTAAGGSGGWWTALTYSQAIGLSIWLLIEAGRGAWLLYSGASWPRGWRAVPLVMAGIVGGFLVGNWIGDTLTGNHALALMLHNASAARVWLAVTVVAGVLGSAYFYAVGRMAAQQAEIVRVERDAGQARLALLQSQLQPHMLFNTLANLRALITADPQRALRMLDHLDGYLRTSLSMSQRAAHPLREEFDGLRDYLELMAVRMGPRLRYQLDLPETLADWPVPPLLLQPLAENAVIHGLEPSVAGGLVRVSAAVDGPLLRLEVADTGAGLQEAEDNAGTGFGLAQLRRRLATLYGAQARVEIGGAEGGGTRVCVELPRRDDLGAPPIEG